MTTSFGTEMRALATELLTEFGISATVTITEGVGGIDANGSPVLPDEATYTVTSSPLINAADVVSAAELQQLGPGRSRMLILDAASLSFVPQAGMRVTVAGETLTVGDIRPIHGDERVASWLLMLEG